jgi:hypothetical protein
MLQTSIGTTRLRLTTKLLILGVITAILYRRARARAKTTLAPARKRRALSSEKAAEGVDTAFFEISAIS